MVSLLTKMSERERIAIIVATTNKRGVRSVIDITFLALPYAGTTFIIRLGNHISSHQFMEMVNFVDNFYTFFASACVLELGLRILSR